MKKKQPRQIVNNYDKLMLLVKDFDKKDIVEKNRILKIFIDQIIYIDKESDIDIVFKV